eukprot:jgi/Mesen1/10855/ME000093S10373
MSEKEELPLTSTTEVQGAAASASSAAAATPEEELTLSIKWSGKEYTVRVCGDDTVGELKRRICEQTNVQPKRQKLLNLKAGGRAADDTMLLSQLTIKPAVKIMMMGTVEEEILVDPVNAPEVVDDFEMGEEETVEIKDREENQQKLRRRAANFQVAPPAASSKAPSRIPLPHPLAASPAVRHPSLSSSTGLPPGEAQQRLSHSSLSDITLRWPLGPPATCVWGGPEPSQLVVV